MSLVNPAALLLAGLALPVIIFYILKIRLRRFPVPTLLFWQQIFEEKKPRSLWQRLRHLLSLLLQLAFLAFLVLALADPIFRWQQAQARRLVLVVDNSSSMNAGDVAPNRLEAAKTEARRLIEGMRLGDELAIIAAAAAPRVVCGPTDHERTLRAAVDSITPLDGPTRITEAVALARRLLSGSEKTRRVVVLTDGGFAGAAELAREEHVELISIGRKTGNVGITRLQARRSLLDPIGYEILVEVSNSSDEPASFRLELDLDDDPIDVVPLTLAAGERSVQVFEKTSADGGRLRASIDLADPFPTDNIAWAILPRRARQKVTLVTPGNLFLEKVFEAIPLVDLEVVKAAKEMPAASSSEPSENVWPGPGPRAPGGEAVAAAGPASKTISVFHRKVPEVLPRGDILLIEPERSGPLWELGEAIHNPVVAKQDKDSPLMMHIRLDNVLMPEARKLTLRTPAKVLAESATGDPLYAVLERTALAGEGKVVILTVDLDKSDLPLQTAFPIMMANLLSWFGGTKGELREALPAGAVTQVDIPQPSGGALARYLVAPDGAEQLLFTSQGTSRLTVGPLDRCGVWSLIEREPADPKRKSEATSPPDAKAGTTPQTTVNRGVTLSELACNLADRRESDLRPADGLPDPKNSLAGGFAVRPIWYYLLASALLLSCWEWYLYQRRWID